MSHFDKIVGCLRPLLLNQRKIGLFLGLFLSEVSLISINMPICHVSCDGNVFYKLLLMKCNGNAFRKTRFRAFNKTMVYLLDGGGPKHSENTLNSYLTQL